VIATNDVHYLEKDHHSSHDVLMCIQSGKNVNDQNRMRYNTTELYLKNIDEMYKAFPGKAEALERTMEIAEKCNVEIETGKILLPQFPLPEEHKKLSLDDYLRKISEEGLPQLYNPVTPELQTRLNHELNVIKEMGYAGYFLIVKDFIDFAKSKKIPVGLGRGSVAGSLVAFVAGITRVDPLKYDLLFERFLNPERISMPDIDIDFCFERREEVIDYVREKYGHDNVSQIITFGTMASRGVIRDVARSLGVEYGAADAWAKLIPISQGKPMPLEEALTKVPELKKMMDEGDELFKSTMGHSLVLEGLARHASIHAAGIIIAPDEITNYVPLHQTEDKGQKVIATQWSMNGCEDIGLLKMDFLGLRTLTVLDHAVKMLKKQNILVDLDDLPLDDSATYEIFCEGNTVGIFQFESKGMQECLRKLKPNRIEDLIAMNALYRPGPMENIDMYIARKHGNEKIDYLHPKLEPILNETYGTIVYQEQVMRIASDLAGFSLAKADILRRAMGKKKKSEMEKMHIEFKEGCISKGLDEETAEAIFDLIAKFASYGFNKSHSAAYALLAFQTAYLKRHYPAEFMAATLSSEINNFSRLTVLISECQNMNLRILPPNINISSNNFDVPNPAEISYALSAIKNVGKSAIGSILKMRKQHGTFKNIFQLMQHVDLQKVNKRVLEALIQAGALDDLEGSRAKNYASIELAISFGQKAQNQVGHKDQLDIFGHLDTDEAKNGSMIRYPDVLEVPDWSIEETLRREKDALGFFLTGHPLDKYKREISLFCTLDWENTDTFQKDREVRTIAMVTQIKTHLDRKGNIMAFISLEDKEHSFEGVVFSSVFEKYGNFIKSGEIVYLRGIISQSDENSFKALCDEIFDASEVWNRLSNRLVLGIKPKSLQEGEIDRLEKILQNYSGDVPLYFEIKLNGTDPGFLMKSKNLKVLIKEDLLNDLQKILGKENIRIE
jgi:DNA polymerase-3 subunit alpha